MTEERKHAILFAATLLCARKLIETMESDKPKFAPKCKGVYIIGYTSFDMARITERILLGLRLVKRIRAEAKLQKTSVTRFVRTAIERYLDELAKQKIAAKDAAGKPKVSLILETPIAFWTQAEKEFADEVIQRHFDEDR